MEKLSKILLATSVFFLAISVFYFVKFEKSQDVNTGLFIIGADLLTTIRQEYKCLPDKYDTKAIVDCVVGFIENVQEVNKRHPALELIK